MSSSHKVTKHINHALRDSVFDRIHDLLWDSSGKIQYNIHRKTHICMYAHIHFNSVRTHTCTHTCCSALSQAVTAVWHQLSCLLVSFSERCPVPSTKTNVAGGDESINQTDNLPIVMFHLQLMCTECLRKFPIMHGQHFQSAPPWTLLIDGSSESDSQIDCCQNSTFLWLMIVFHTNWIDAPLSGTQHRTNTGTPYKYLG